MNALALEEDVPFDLVNVTRDATLANHLCGVLLRLVGVDTE